MRRLRHQPTLMGVCLAVSLSACGLPPEGHPRALSADEVPRGAVRTPAPAASGSSRVLVYLSKDNVLVAVSRSVPSAPDPSVVLQALVAGPSRREQDAGLVSAVSATTFGQTVKVAVGGIAVIDVPAPEASSSGRTDEVLAYAQVVLTLTSLTTVHGVRFARDGKPLSVPRGDGTLSTGPLTRRDYSDLL